MGSHRTWRTSEEKRERQLLSWVHANCPHVGSNVLVTLHLGDDSATADHAFE
jgi:hypothetical protein